MTPTVNALHGALTAAEFNFKKARPGDQLRLVFRHGQLDVLDYRRSLLTEWQVRREGDRYIGRKREIEREQRVDTVELDRGVERVGRGHRRRRAARHRGDALGRLRLGRRLLP